MHQPSETQRGVHGRSSFTHIHSLLQLFLQPQWISSFQLTTIAGSYGNQSQLQVQKRVSNIWKVSYAVFTNRCAVRIFSVPIRTPKVPLTSKATTAVRTNSDYGRVSCWKHDPLDTFLYCVGHMDHHFLDDFFTQLR